MTANNESAQLEVVLKEIYPRWTAWLRLRHRSLEPIHADLVQDASADLVQYLSRQAPQRFSDEDIRRIGFTILRRRVADAFRSQTIQWVEDFPLDQLPSTDSGANPDMVLHYTKLLRVVIGLMAKLDKPSRELLLRANDATGGGDSPLSDAERQRLSRLRADLRRQLTETYGIDIKQFLKE